jgi:hypothetical protein
LKVYGIAVALSPRRESSQQEEKIMQIEKGTKLLKRIWKAVVYIDLVIVTGALLFLSQYFSWNVFMSNFHQQATAATSSVQPR